MDKFDESPDTERTPTTAVRMELDAVVDNLQADEIRVLTSIARRLRFGADTYGELLLAEDTRKFRDKEAREEVEDALVYLACAWLVESERGS